MGAGASIEDISEDLKNHLLKKDEIDAYLLTFFRFEDHADTNGQITFGKLSTLLKDKYDVFLTHDWGAPGTNDANHVRVIDICQRLEKKYIKCWLDHELMENNIHETMIEGIDASNAVVVFITPRYIEKVGGTYEGDNCKLEFKYAARVKTSAKMLGVVMEDSVRSPQCWKGPVGFILGGDIYVDFVSEEDLAMEKQIEELLSRIMSKLGGTTIRKALESMAQRITKGENMMMLSPSPSQTQSQPFVSPHSPPPKQSQAILAASRLEEMEEYRDVFGIAEFLEDGYTLQEVYLSGFFPLKEFIDSYCTIPQLLDMGVELSELKAAGCSAKQLLDSGIDKSMLKKLGYLKTEYNTVEEMKAKLNVAQLLKFGFTYIYICIRKH